MVQNNNLILAYTIFLRELKDSQNNQCLKSNKIKIDSLVSNHILPHMPHSNGGAFLSSTYGSNACKTRFLQENLWNCTMQIHAGSTVMYSQRLDEACTYCLPSKVQLFQCMAENSSKNHTSSNVDLQFCSFINCNLIIKRKKKKSALFGGEGGTLKCDLRKNESDILT